jgi:hypothetical protein
VNKQRLLKLADLLETDAKNKNGVKFDLTTWGQVSDSTKPVSCGTSACAMGLAALSGAFKKQGLQYEVGGTGYLHVGINGEWGGFYAAQKLFDISGDEAEWLFDVDGYGAAEVTGAKGEHNVAKRLRDFVAGKISCPVYAE